MPKVKLPNGQILNFPEGTEHDVMRNAIYKRFPEYAQQAKPEHTGLAGIGHDVAESLRDVPNAVYNMASNIPEELAGAASHPLRALGNVGAGLGEGAIGLFNAPGNISKYLAKKEVGPEWYSKFMKHASQYIPHIGDLGIEKKLFGEQQAGDALVRGLASFAVPGKLGKFGEAGAGGRAGIAAEHAIGQNEDPIKEALLSEVGGQALHGLERLKPSNLFRGQLSPQELLHNLEITKHTETPLGEVVQSPFLKRLHENILPHIIGSGVEDVMQRTAKQIQHEGKALVNKYNPKGIPPEDFGLHVQHVLKQAAEQSKQTKNANFNKVNAAADAAGITTNRSNLRDEAKSMLEQVKSDPDLAQFMDNKDTQLLHSLANPKDKNAAYSLKNTDILRGKIGALAHEATVKGEESKAKLYGGLKKALQSDIEHSINNSGNPEIKSLHEQAMDYYRKEYSKYKDKDIRKFIKEGGDPDLLISHFIKGGKNDRATILGKLSSAVQQQTHGTNNILAGSYLSRAFDNEGNLNPMKLKALYHNLGKNQKTALFGAGEQHQQLKNFTDLVHKNKEAFELMFNPKTGARSTEAITKLSQLGAAVAHGAAGSGLQGFLLPLIAAGLSGRAATKLLTSPKVRESVVGAMLGKPAKHKIISKIPKYAENIARGLAPIQEERKPLELLMTKGRNS